MVAWIGLNFPVIKSSCPMKSVNSQRQEELLTGKLQDRGAVGDAKVVAFSEKCLVLKQYFFPCRGPSSMKNIFPQLMMYAISIAITLTMIRGGENALAGELSKQEYTRVSRAMQEAVSRARAAEYKGDVTEANRLYSWLLVPTEEFFGKESWRADQLRRLRADNDWITSRSLDEQQELLSGLWSINKQRDALDSGDFDAALRWGKRADEFLKGKERVLFRHSEVILSNCALHLHFRDLDSSYDCAERGLNILKAMDATDNPVFATLIGNQCEVLNRQGNFVREFELAQPHIEKCFYDQQFADKQSRRFIVQKFAELNRDIGCLDLAAKCHLAALRDCPKSSLDRPYNLLKLCEIELSEGKVTEARNRLKTTRSVIDMLEQDDPWRAYFTANAAILAWQIDVPIDSTRVGESIKIVRTTKTKLFAPYMGSYCEAVMMTQRKNWEGASLAIEDAIRKATENWCGHHPRLEALYSLQSQIEAKLGNADASRVAGAIAEKCAEQGEVPRQQLRGSIANVIDKIDAN